MFYFVLFFIVIYCKVIGVLIYGIKFLFNYNEGSMIIFMCNVGYIFIKFLFRICWEGGWIGNYFKCLGIIIRN